MFFLSFILFLFMTLFFYLILALSLLYQKKFDICQFKVKNLYFHSFMCVIYILGICCYNRKIDLKINY